MKRRFLSSVLISIIAGAAALADDHMPFDSMGAMMLEHEAEEALDGRLSRSAQLNRCEEQDAELQARLRELEAVIAQSLPDSLIYFDTTHRKAFETQAARVAERIKQLELEKATGFAAVRASLAEHSAVLEKYRPTFKDQALFRQVQDALAEAERAISAN